MKNPPRYLAIQFPEGEPAKLMRRFDDELQMDDFSRECGDADTFIYRLGTDFLKDGHTEGAIPNVKVVNNEVNKATSSIEIGTTGKGGGVKVYFDPADPEEMLERIDHALIGKGYAASILALHTNQNGTLKGDGQIAEKYDELVEKHAERSINNEWRNKRD